MGNCCPKDHTDTNPKLKDSANPVDSYFVKTDDEIYQEYHEIKSR